MHSLNGCSVLPSMALTHAQIFKAGSSLESRGDVEALVAAHYFANVLHTGAAQGIQEREKVQQLCVLSLHLPRLDLQQRITINILADLYVLGTSAHARSEILKR